MIGNGGELAIIVAVPAVLFVALLGIRAWSRPAGEPSSGARGVVLALAAAINLAGVIGLARYELATVPYDGVDAAELGIVAVLALLLIAPTWIALRLHRRGRTRLPIVLVLCGAIPTTLAFALVAILLTHPIDMR